MHAHFGKKHAAVNIEFESRKNRLGEVKREPLRLLADYTRVIHMQFAKFK